MTSEYVDPNSGPGDECATSCVFHDYCIQTGTSECIKEKYNSKYPNIAIHDTETSTKEE